METNTTVVVCLDKASLLIRRSSPPARRRSTCVHSARSFLPDESIGVGAELLESSSAGGHYAGANGSSSMADGGYGEIPVSPVTHSAAASAASKRIRLSAIGRFSAA